MKRGVAAAATATADHFELCSDLNNDSVSMHVVIAIKQTLSQTL